MWQRSARYSFFTLLIGFLAILIASMFVFSIYQSYSRRHVDRFRFAVHFMKSVSLARVIEPNKLKYHLWELDGMGLRFHVRNNPAKNTIRVYDNTYGKKLRALAHKHAEDLKVSVLLSDGKWLVVRGRLRKFFWFQAGSFISISILLIVLIGLCWWVVNRLALPTRQFVKAAKRFSVDLQSPPMAVEGPPELQEIISAFNEMQDRIRRLMNDRTQMLAAISHDLRTPITRLQLRVEYLQGTPQYDKAVADLNEMQHMISSILAFARDYASDEVMEKFDINALLDSVCDELNDVGHEVTYDGNGRVVMLGRIVAIKRALINVIENAIKYGDKADVNLQLQDNKVVMKVSDNGPGIPAGEMERVFAPFYRVDKSRSPQKSGTGLGLATARDIIRSHGGDITLHNREPNGLTVIIELPLQ